MRKRFPKLKSWLFTLSGILYAWLVLGSLAGYVLSEHLYGIFYGTGGEWIKRYDKCYPTFSDLGGYNVRCNNIIAKWLWIVLLCLPSALLSIFVFTVIIIFAIPFTMNY